MKKIKILSKFNQDLFWSVLVICFFFLSTNALAQEESQINIPEAHKSTVETVNLANGADADEYNSARSQAVNATTAVSNAIVYLAPEVTEGAEAIRNSDTITPDMKRGVYGMTQDGVMALFEAQPQVNLYAHLANEWIPGYEESTASVYAATQTGPYDSGYTELMNSGINSIWSQVRNLAYVFFVIIMIVVGFMIMFRSKIGGQTLVTLGNALPNVVLALIGVTFSFAIAGFIIDLGGVLMRVLVDIFENITAFGKLVTLESFGSIFQSFGGLLDINSLDPSGKGFLSIFGIGSAGLWGGSAAATAAIAAGSISASPLVVAMLPVLTTVGLVGLVIILAIIGVAIVGTFKVMITLVKAYVGILFGVITGPIQIAMSALPGKGNGFMNWILSILRNVLVYPIVFAILNLPGVIFALSGEGGLSLPGPDKLTLAQSANQINQSTDFISGFLIFILQIFVLFAASKADQYVKAIIPPTTSKAGGEAAGAVKQALSGIPLVGSLIK